ncbi:MAG: hypothetical protein GF330_13370 [Candidatus Eisenbacteria bacterium]|nr:hypothetical protein [Candidatus Eisenbacteria bacterium]
MQDPQAPERPLSTLIRLMLRTAWMLYGAFWLSLGIYAVVLLALPALLDTPAFELDRAPQTAAPWAHWQFLLAAVGAVSVYVSLRLRGRLLHPQRLRRGSRNLYELAEMLRRHGEESRDPGEMLGRAVQDLLGRALTAHVILWLLVEIPAILGIVDRLISGDPRLFVGLTILSAAGLVLQRPSRERFREMIGPLAG